MKKTIVKICAVLLIILTMGSLAFAGFIFYCRYSQERDKLARNLSNLTYNAVQESSWNNGEYLLEENSPINLDSVAEECFLLMNVFKQDKNSFHNIKVNSFEVSFPEVKLSNFSNTATAVYHYDVKYCISSDVKERSLHYACTVKWKRQRDGNWKIVDYYEVSYEKYTENLCKLSYDIIQESSWNNSDYEKSDYADLVSKEHYERMNVFKKELFIKIKSFSVTNLEITFQDDFNAIVSYVYDYQCITIDRTTGAIADCQITWELQDDGIWRVVDFYERA